MPEMMPPEGAQREAGGVPEIVSEVGKGLTEVAGLFKDTGAPPEVVEKMVAIANEYNNLISQIGGTAASPDPSGANVRPEAAGNVEPVR